MKKEYRLKKKKDIDKVFSKKKSVGNLFFSVFFIKNEFKHFRFSISIGKKFGKAYTRNKIKRQIRQIVSDKKEVLKSYDFVIVVKPKSNVLNFSDIQKNIYYMLSKINLLENK